MIRHDAQEKEATATVGMLGQLYQLLCRPFLHSITAAEINTCAQYFDRTIQLTPLAHDTLHLFSLVKSPQKLVAKSLAEIPTILSKDDRSLILLNGNLNHSLDAQFFLQNIKARLNRHSRVCVVVYNSYLRWLYVLGNLLHIRAGELPTTFLTQHDLKNLCSVSGYELVRARPCGYIPLRLWGLGKIFNAILSAIPVLRWLGFCEILILRPIIADTKMPSLSVIIPARNERGNIENTLKRIGCFADAQTEVIIVEGGSSDGTWEEIERILPLYKDKFSLHAFRQSGTGKNDAVRLGISKASCDLVTILDADLTVPPELLERFYLAYTSGSADFLNGNRLLYPMEGEAMRLLNWVGNVFFAKMLCWLLDTKIGDSLCGTKLMSRRDYARFTAWRSDFGDFDPFGDFELLFPASILGVGIVDIPLRYRSRTYGETNIHRFRHGLQLLKMSLIGFVRVKLNLK